MPKKKVKDQQCISGDIDRVMSADPGIFGGLVLLDRGRISKAYKMPIVKEGDNHRVDPLSIVYCLQESQPQVVVMELPQFRPGSSAQSLGTTGINWGILYGVIKAQGIPIVTVHASVWTQKLHSLDKRCHEIEDTKAKAKLVFDKLYPAGHGNPKIKADHDGVIDAALIGFWWLWENNVLSRYKTRQ
jgi:hypothetical protein